MLTRMGAGFFDVQRGINAKEEYAPVWDGRLLALRNDAPTTALEVGLPPRRGIVLSFDAKESTKESMRHGDSGKKPFTAHF